MADAANDGYFVPEHIFSLESDHSVGGNPADCALESIGRPA
jgi:hypothetical protein